MPAACSPPHPQGPRWQQFPVCCSGIFLCAGLLPGALTHYNTPSIECAIQWQATQSWPPCGRSSNGGSWCLDGVGLRSISPTQAQFALQCLFDVFFSCFVMSLIPVRVQKLEQTSCPPVQAHRQEFSRPDVLGAVAWAAQRSRECEHRFFTSGAFLCHNALMRPHWSYLLKI